MRNIVIDTNCYSAFLTGDEKVLDALAAAEVVFMSVFVLGELFAGFKAAPGRKKTRGCSTAFLTSRLCMS